MLRENTRQWSLIIVWLIALTSLIVTQYASNVLGMPVCHLCWYQRIFIYPLTIIIGIAAFRNDGEIGIYTIPLTILGGLVALFQYLEQMIPGLASIATCKQGPSCSEIHLKIFGFITFPFLTMIACIVMTLFLFVAYFSREIPPAPLL